MEAQADQVQQMKEVIDFLAQGNVEQKAGALDIILNFSATPEQRKLFVTTDVSKELLRQVPAIQNSDHGDKVATALRDVRLKALKCLINFSQDKEFVDQLCECGIANRVYEVLKENVRQDLKNAELPSAEQQAAKLNQAKNAFELVGMGAGDNLLKGQQAVQEQTIEHSFMLLSNVTGQEVGQKHLLGVEADGKGKFAFIIAESIFGMFCYFTKNQSFDFVANVMANLAGQQDGRKFMIDHKYIEAISVQMLTKQLNGHRRKYLIQCMRNLLFEYETFEEKFLEMNVPRDICKLLLDEEGITEDKLAASWKPYAAKSGKDWDKIDWVNVQQLIDGLVLLANSDELLKRMKTIELDLMLNALHFPAQGFEDTKLRIEVLENQMIGLDLDAKDEKDEEKQDEEEAEEPMPELSEQK